MTDVLKFGGTSVGSAERIRDVACLVAKRGGDPCVVVVSALGGVTDELVGLKISSNGKERAGADFALEALARRHRAALDELHLPAADAAAVAASVDEELHRARILSTGISLLEEVSPRTSDALLSVGEMISSRLVAAALRAAGVAAVWVDPRDVLVTDAAHGAALPDEEETTRRVASHVIPHLEAGRVVVTGGFVGATREGVTTTLGRGGSDYSAALFGAALKDAGRGVGALEIWTDVDGILTADPRVVPAARLVPEVSPAEAAELAFFGAKVLHPATIRPAVARGIPVSVRNSFRPDAPGTVVRPEAPGTGVRALAMRTGVSALFVGNPRMLLAHGYAPRSVSLDRKSVV